MNEVTEYFCSIGYKVDDTKATLEWYEENGYYYFTLEIVLMADIYPISIKMQVKADCYDEAYSKFVIFVLKELQSRRLQDDFRQVITKIEEDYSVVDYRTI